MNNKHQKLELTWIGKDEQPRLEPRILIEDAERSYGHTPTPLKRGLKSPLLGGETGVGNMLIHGDNLLALKALEQDFAGKIKCIYIDPPYNTGNAFEHYDDGLEHSIWLSLIKPRIELLHRLLSNDGSIWISIDADESHYLKVLCDEIFGRKNFVDEVIWQRAYAPINLKKTLSRSHDTILVYSKNINGFQLNKLARTEKQLKDYKNPDNDYRGHWKVGNPSVGPAVERNIYEVYTPSGRKLLPPKGRSWLYSKERYEELLKDNRIWFGPNGDSTWAPKLFLSEVREGVVAMTLWTYDEVGHNQDAKKEIKELFPNDSNPFTTPKPERLIQRILTLATNPGDWVLDSFLGSGTTAAVAHKMRRRWIGIELGEHCHTHCLPRLKKVVDGTDEGGISKTVNWQGGGGFKYYYLAPSLLKEDKYGNWIIDEQYNADMLAAAMAKHEGFKYSPDEQIYWKQGKSTEKDYIFTTTNFVTVAFLDKIHDEMQPEESLLICCKSFSKACGNRYPNITVKKIPNLLLGRCEFGKEDYSLNIVNMPHPPDPSQEGNEESPEQSPPLAKGSNGRAKKGRAQKSLFSEEEANEKK